MGGDIVDSVPLMWYPSYTQQDYIDNVNRFVSSKVKADFQSRGYRSTYEVIHPLKKEKNVPSEFKMMRGYKYNFYSGKEFGTTVELTWNPKVPNAMELKLSEMPVRKKNIIHLSQFLLVIALYALTIIFEEYWLFTIITLFICFLLTFLMLILPAIIGIYLGEAIGKLVYSSRTHNEVKEHNLKDRKFMHSEIMGYARPLAGRYTAQMHQPPPVYHPAAPPAVQPATPPTVQPTAPPAVQPAAPLAVPSEPRTTEFCPNCGCEIPLGEPCPICT